MLDDSRTRLVRPRLPFLALLVWVVGACSGPAATERMAPPSTDAASPVASVTSGASTTAAMTTRPFPPLNLRWFRTSAERQAAYAQAFRYAWQLVESTEKGAAWAVVVDADETVLDNSEYVDRIARMPQLPGDAEADKLWDDWTLEERAPAFAPARTFLERVRAAGGRIVVVTNRVESTCGPTRNNLTAQKIPFDAVLCAPSWTDTAKQPRFDAVANGSAVPSAGPLSTVLYVGDSIKDCPHQTQSSFDERLFGERCVVLPNPMYGSWESNPYR
jgi:5'-nucleotidase (lipoprotein e(P4) family)